MALFSIPFSLTPATNCAEVLITSKLADSIVYPSNLYPVLDGFTIVGSVVFVQLESLYQPYPYL